LADEGLLRPKDPGPDAEGRSTALGKQYRSAGSFALAAAEATNWDEAKSLSARGGRNLATEAGFEARIPAALRQFIRVEALTEDLRLDL
jgi:hypothetical protein